MKRFFRIFMRLFKPSLDQVPVTIKIDIIQEPIQVSWTPDEENLWWFNMYVDAFYNEESSEKELDLLLSRYLDDCQQKNIEPEL